MNQLKGAEQQTETDMERGLLCESSVSLVVDAKRVGKDSLVLGFHAGQEKQIKQ